MTDDEAKALGARALATWLWTDKMGLWPEGSLDCEGRRIICATFYDGPVHTFAQSPDVTGRDLCIEDDTGGPMLSVPDFRDDPTRGALLGRVREAWRQPGIRVERWQIGQMWSMWSAMGDDEDHNGELTPPCATEAEALVVSLEIAAARVKP